MEHEKWVFWLKIIRGKEKLWNNLAVNCINGQYAEKNKFHRLLCLYILIFFEALWFRLSVSERMFHLGNYGINSEMINIKM